MHPKDEISSPIKDPAMSINYVVKLHTGGAVAVFVPNVQCSSYRMWLVGTA